MLACQLAPAQHSNAMLAGFNGYWTDLNIEDSPRSVSKRLTARDPSLNQVGAAAALRPGRCTDWPQRLRQCGKADNGLRVGGSMPG